MRALRLAIALAFLTSTSLALAAEQVDTDGDGLSDFQELHKYFTDPSKRDSDADGTPDGDWDERREYAYTIRSVVRVMNPVSRGLTDDYQDARQLERTDTWTKLEVIHYPLNTVATAIKGRAAWREAAGAMKRETSSTLTSNFDEALAKKIVDLLKRDGIDVAALDDKTLVEKAAPWFLNRVKSSSEAFTGYFTHFPKGKPAVCPGCEAGMKDYNRKRRSPAEQWSRDLFAKSMFEHGTCGSCTSTAIYLTGMLRAIGIPTRIVYCIPVIDASDPEELLMLGGIRQPQVRKTLKKAMSRLKQQWAGHTFNEVFVGGRWCRLNYTVLGQNTYGPRIFGLVTHVLTVNDWSEADVAKSIGVRQSPSTTKRDIFGHQNPYSAVELSDRFGVHMKREPIGATVQKHGGPMTLVDFAWSDSAEGKRVTGGSQLPGGRLLARVKDYDGDFEALKAYQQSGSRIIWLQPNKGTPVAFDMGSGGITRSGRAWVILSPSTPDGVTQYRGEKKRGPFTLRAEDSARWQLENATVGPPVASNRR